MKKLFLASFAIIAFSLLSQAQFKLGIVAGGDLSKQRINISEGNGLFSNDKYKSYHAGLVSEIQITEHIYIQPQVLYTRKGATLLHSTGEADTKIRINYINLPVNVLYKLSVPFGKVFGGAGPSFSYGFGGKQQQGAQKSGIYGNHSNWKHEDVGLSFTAGVEFNNGLFASINSQKGLLDVYKADGASIKNRSVAVSIGYLIDWNSFKRNR